MYITVFGASGKVGSLLVQEALDHNLKVVAFVHGKPNLIKSKNLKIVYGDINNLSEVENAVKGADVIFSALGSWGTPGKDILATGMKNIIPSMQKHGVKRIISVTGADASIKSDHLGVFNKLTKMTFKLFAKKIIQDGEDHIQLLLNSDLDWTVVRSPIMNDRGKSNNFSLTDIKPAPWATINRKSVARAMFNLIYDQNFLKQTPFIQRIK